MYQTRERNIDYLERFYGNELLQNFKVILGRLGYVHAITSSLIVSHITDQSLNIVITTGETKLVLSYNWQQYLANVQITKCCNN